MSKIGLHRPSICIHKSKKVPSKWKDFHGVGLIEDSFMEDLNYEHELESSLRFGLLERRKPFWGEIRM